MNTAEELEISEKPKSNFALWCENLGVDPQEVEQLATDLRISPASLRRLPMGDPAWLTKLRQQGEETKARRSAWAAKWAQDSVGPESFRKLTGQQMFRILPEKLRELTRHWRPEVGALLLGPTGAGKSMAACFLARRTIYERMQAATQWHYAADNPEQAFETTAEDDRPFLSERYGVLWASAPALSMARRRHALGKGEPRLVDRAMRAKLLVLDDVGREPGQDNVVPEVLWERFDRNGLSTIATSGDSEAKLSDRYGAALIRRIHEIDGEQGFVVDLFPGVVTP
ncbi:MAG TPA: hypothetical protein VGK73_09020 [Polyangiaceae bacterium]